MLLGHVLQRDLELLGGVAGEEVSWGSLFHQKPAPVTSITGEVMGAPCCPLEVDKLIASLQSWMNTSHIHAQFHIHVYTLRIDIHKDSYTQKYTYIPTGTHINT